MVHKFLVAVMVLMAFGCQKPDAQDTTAVATAKVSEDLGAAALNTSVKQTLDECKMLMADANLTEERLDAGITKIETLTGQIDQINADKATLNDAELMSMLGALYVRKAGFNAHNPREAGTLASKGFRYLDRALIKYPDNITARINRGIISARVPEFMNKTEVAREDLDFVVGSTSFANLPPSLQASLKSMQDEVHLRLAQGIH